MAGMSPAAVCVCIDVVDCIVHQFKQLGGSLPGVTMRGDMITSQGIDAGQDNLLSFDLFFSTALNKEQKKC
jgi:hypothetical protein